MIKILTRIFYFSLYKFVLIEEGHYFKMELGKNFASSIKAQVSTLVKFAMFDSRHVWQTIWQFNH